LRRSRTCFLLGWLGDTVEVSIGAASGEADAWGDPAAVASFAGTLARAKELAECEHPYADDAYRFLFEEGCRGFVLHRETFRGAHFLDDDELAIMVGSIMLLLVRVPSREVLASDWVT
jgi:hypothetical protein